jgi:hypothetical protein
MSFSEFDDCFVWQCDRCRTKAIFPPGNFWGAVAELRARRWEFDRDDRDGGWSHLCGKCRKTGAEILDSPVVRKMRG